jgi:tetratricopeptide (TPR) repeat protein
MRRLLRPSTLVPIAIIAATAAMVAYANWRDIKRAREEQASATAPRRQGAPKTTREDLARRTSDLRAKVSGHPEDVASAVLLADALLRQTRVTGNVGLAKECEQVLKVALVQDPGNYDANRMLGALYLSQHRFREAIQAAEKNRDARPADPVNYGVIGDGHLELGEYDQAFESFDHMMNLRPSPAAYARVAYARELQGNLAGALESMKLSAEATSAEDLEAQAWTHSQVGDLYFQLGRFQEARQEYIAASQAFPGHPFAVIGYAKTIAHEGDPSGALTLLQKLAATSPTPDLAARIGDLLEQLGRHDEAERQYALAEAGWKSDAPEPKNLARFLADHDRKIDEAVTIAERARSDRNDIFTDDALAWAYYKAGRLDDAAKASAESLRTGSRDRELVSHAAAIKQAVGERDAARDLLARALPVASR